MDCFPPFLFVGETWEDMVNYTGFLFGLHCHWDVIIAPQSLIFPSLVQVAQSRECSFWLLLSIYVVVLNAWWHVTLLSRANLSHAVPKTWHAPFFWYGASQASGNALSLKEGPKLFIDRYHQKLGLPWWVSIKSPLPMQVTQVRKIPWRREWPPTPVFLPGESHGKRSLAGPVHRVAKSQTWLSNRAHTHQELKTKFPGTCWGNPGLRARAPEKRCGTPGFQQIHVASVPTICQCFPESKPLGI